MNKKENIEVIFMGEIYGINLSNNNGLDDLVYDMKLNQTIDDCYPVDDIRDLKECFDDGLLNINERY